MLLLEERKMVVAYGKALMASGLVKSTGGNLSVCNREKSLLAVTPSGVPYGAMRPEDVVVLDLEGDYVEGIWQPSSEVAFHLDLVKLRPDILAVVHTHSNFATTLACLGWPLPALHYLIGVAGHCVPVAPYATTGTQALSDHICETMGSGNAVLMANHGMVGVGSTLKQAFGVAEMVEYVAQLYVQARSLGEPVILGEPEMDEVLEKFKVYGQKKLKE